ncbi:putative reverse transcriptase domain-containing protein [Tanacetum coccineum]
MNSHCSAILNDALPQKEKDPGSFTLPCFINNLCFSKALIDLGACISVIPYSTFINLDLGKLAPTTLIVELADRTVKCPKGIAENVLVGIDKFVFPVDFIILDMPEDIKTLLILGRPFLSTAHAIIDVFKRKIALRVGNDKIVFKSNNPTNRSQDLEFRDFLELNEPLELRNQDMEDLGPTIEEGEVIDELMEDIVKTSHNDNEIIDEYPSFCDFDRKIHINYAYSRQFSCMIGYEHVNANFFPILSINVMSKNFYNLTMKDKVEYKGKNVVGAFINVHIFVGNVSIVTNFVVVENMDAYSDKDMGDVIVEKPFSREVCVKARPLLKVSACDKLEGISHPYQKLKGFYKRVLNSGPEYIKDEKTVEWLTREHVSIHDMD